jgi:hypothetical protein
MEALIEDAVASQCAEFAGGLAELRKLLLPIKTGRPRVYA